MKSVFNPVNKPQKPIYEFIHESDTEETIEIGRLWGTVIDESKVIIAIAIVFLFGGIVNALFSTPVYKADALLQVEPKNSAMPGLGELTGAFEMDSEAITEIEVLKSRMVMGRVVDELNLQINAEPRFMPLIGEGLSRMLGNSGKDLFVSMFSSFAWDSEQIHVARFEVPDDLVGEELTLVAGNNDTYEVYYEDTQLLTGKVGEMAKGAGASILVTDLTQREGLEFSLRYISRLAAVRSLQKDISVNEKGRNSGVLSVSLEGTQKEQTRKILDSVSRQYLMQNVQRMSAEAQKSLEFLEKQLPDIKQKLRSAEAMLNNYRLKNESVDLSLETKSILDQMVELESKLNELALEETKLKKRFTKQHPNYVALLEKRTQLTEEKQKLQNKIKNLPETQQEILRLSRDVEVNQAIYVEMLNKAQELSIAKAGTVGNVRILDHAALLSDPIKPRKGSIIIVSLILGLLLGIGVAFVRVALRRGIQDPAQLEAIGLPVYSTIPLSEMQQKLVKEQRRRKAKGASPGSALLANEDPDDTAVEAIRSLRTSMHFAMLELEKNILMITGSSPELGKSFVSTNLAVVYAKSGQKVLVIDGDLRRGHMHLAFNTESTSGLSEVLSNQITKEKAVRKTEIEGVDFVPCGTKPPNPSELLMHKNMQDFLQWASQEYDLVIIDTPPVLAVTDATVVGRYVGVTMFVARFEKTQRKEVEIALRRCEQSGIDVKGCILNGILNRKGSAYGYYDSYRYTKYKTAED
jgi:tyrosine-protein kinase Etk/Wzc